nr:MAG TPA: hypothetical protein [Crassvirales sp.]
MLRTTCISCDPERGIVSSSDTSRKLLLWRFQVHRRHEEHSECLRDSLGSKMLLRELRVE